MPPQLLLINAMNAPEDTISTYSFCAVFVVNPMLTKVAPNPLVNF